MARSRASFADPADVPHLVERAQAGDRAAFGELHRRYAGMVHATLLARIAPSEADDLAQETFVVAWLRLGDLQDTATFGRWIQSIARRKAADQHRRRRATVPLPDTLSRPPRLTAEAREVLGVLRGMPKHLGEPLAMRLIKGMTGPEIAAVTGHTHGSVRVTLHRAMKHLRAALEIRDA